MTCLTKTGKSAINLAMRVSWQNGAAPGARPTYLIAPSTILSITACMRSARRAAFSSGKVSIQAAHSSRPALPADNTASTAPICASACASLCHETCALSVSHSAAAASYPQAAMPRHRARSPGDRHTLRPRLQENLCLFKFNLNTTRRRHANRLPSVLSHAHAGLA